MPQANPTDLRSRLAGIQTFPQLVAFLRDDMSWPIEKADFEDLTFEYEPEELGIDPKNAAKIKSPGGIKRLRPLVASQPWGVFFVQFEKGRLPVVALRRILSSVAVKARPTAGAAHRPAWNPDDLLFVSSYGEGEDRQISFAHFSAAKEKEDLPTLKVLGWDNLDTPLHLDAVARALGQHLSWPADDSDRDGWREQWRAAFTLRHREVITTSKELSLRLAQLARTIRARINTALAIESERGPLKTLMKAFQTALVHDLDADGFADMYAQTIAYGLLSARIADPHGKTADDFAVHMRTNPFLRELMETFLKVGGRRGKAGGQGIDFDELGVSEIVELLDDANMEAVVRDFGDRNRQEDPVIHFYELFLKEYDAKKRMQRGVFYTPRPVVSYIVRSVDELLRTEFGLPDGLADTTTWGEMAQRHQGLKIPESVSPDQDFVQILDPATGTGTFLVEVIGLIHKTLVAKWTSQGHGGQKINALWNEYVPKHLLKRLHGYELLMAPYAIAHLKIGLKLYETGYRFASDERARVYLTNALEPAMDCSGRFDFAIPALAREAQAVSDVKQHNRFTVVIGNPPYAGHSANDGEWIAKLLDDYYKVGGEPLGERTAKWLQDDYVKFIRLGDNYLASTGRGILSFITNHGYLDNPTFRGMRFALLKPECSLRILDLHGNLKKKERTPAGGLDENVFDIQPGVAIFLASLRGRNSGQRLHSQLFGMRAEKYRVLLESSASEMIWARFEPSPPFFILYPQDTNLREEYAGYWKTTDIFPLNGVGMTTARDHVVIDFEQRPLLERVKQFRDSTVSDSELCRVMEMPEKKGWNVRAARRRLRAEHSLEQHICGVTYRPFDDRLIFYHDSLVWRTVRKVMRHMLAGGNLGLAVGRAGQVIDQGEWNLVFATRKITEFNLYRRGGNNLAPLYVHPAAEGLALESLVVPNLAAGFLRALAARLSLSEAGPIGLPDGISPEDIFNNVYAVLHSPGYRRRYAEFLRIDFPRLPLTGSLELFHKLARLGGQLTALHLLESSKLAQLITEPIGSQKPEVEKVCWFKNAVWLDGAQTNGFRGVREEVWRFQVGGYQVCEKWLKDRKGRRLSKDDIAHYQKIVVAISETIRLMKEIDEVIEQHGGWPGAFETGEAKAAPAKVVPFRPRTVEPKPEERYVTCVPLVPIEAAAGAFGDPQHIDDEGFEWVAVESRHRLRPGMFVAQVVGKSMEPGISDGGYCLFRAPVEGSRQGKTVLVELRDAVDPDTGERYTVKRYESEKRGAEGSWRHEAITLKPVNPDFQSIVLEAGDEERLRVVAELVAVLGPDDTSEPSGTGRVTAVNKPASSEGRSAQRRGGQEDRQSSLLDPGEAAPSAEPVPTAGEPDRDELVCSIRQLLGDGRRRNRETLIQELARELGHERVEPGVRDALEGAVRAAARRGVIQSDRDEVTLLARAITDYEKAFLKEQFLASLGGKAWRTRDEAVRAFACWMGFRRTGKLIQDTGRSLITGLLRSGALEAGEQGMIRKA